MSPPCQWGLGGWENGKRTKTIRLQKHVFIFRRRQSNGRVGEERDKIRKYNHLSIPQVSNRCQSETTVAKTMAGTSLR